MTSLNEDIEYLKAMGNNVLLDIAAETSRLLSDKQDLLNLCKWTDGESNTDTDFSELACKCAEEAWINIKYLYPLQIGRAHV